MKTFEGGHYWYPKALRDDWEKAHQNGFRSPWMPIMLLFQLGILFAISCTDFWKQNDKHLWINTHQDTKYHDRSFSEQELKSLAIKARSVTLEVCLLQDLRDEEVWTCTPVPAANITRQLMFFSTPSWSSRVSPPRVYTLPRCSSSLSVAYVLFCSHKLVDLAWALTWDTKRDLTESQERWKGSKIFKKPAIWWVKPFLKHECIL